MLKGLWVVFVTVFLAEMADKTQLATLLFATDAKLNKWGVFLAASLALTLACAIGVLVGAQAAKMINPQKLKIVAGVGFIIIGAWNMWDGFKT